ncbi:hypothetical protein [Agrobacterium sp.]|jgi:hypothetical protein|uniref:hypothetical protein n=1 Tax=Agrobacterium sp. TaxID=361 RepID=UPI0028B10763|nr:hypothetical protein [Agrobacterium sp.]
MQSSSAFPDRDTVAAKLTTLSGEDQAWLKLLMENVQQEESFLSGLQLYLEQQTAARFLNSLKLEACGEWLGANTPARLQIRLNEVSRSSQHPAFAAFKKGVVKSGGFEKAYPKSTL